MAMACKQPENKTSSGAAGGLIALLQDLGALFTALLGAAFLLLAFYLLYNDYETSGQFSSRILMMPMMNVLIASMLLFSCRRLFSQARATRVALRNGTYVPPRIFVTRYDIAAILAFLLVVAIASYFLIR